MSVEKLSMEDIKRQLAFLGRELTQELLDQSTVQEIPKGTELLREEQFIKVLPIVLDGLVKVYSRFRDRELLLYYIQPQQSCVMSFSAALKNQPSRVFATTEQDSRIMLIPTEKIPDWLHRYPRFGTLFYEQYDLRYAELLDTIQHILINKMDKRLYDYLREKTEILGAPSLKISHNQIANELGTVREVVSRVIKKLEVEGKVEQKNNRIKIL